jgi:hypothetical protein
VLPGKASVTDAGRPGEPRYTPALSPSRDRPAAPGASAVPPSVICAAGPTSSVVSSTDSGVAQKHALDSMVATPIRAHSARM